MIEITLAQLHTPSMAAFAPWGIALAATAVAAISDMRTRRIPNLLTFPMLFSGLLVSLLPGNTISFQEALLGCLVLGVPYFFLFVFAGGGAGDAKMMGAIGAWVGFTGSIPVLVGVALSGGVLAIGYALIRRRFAAVSGNLRAMATGAALMTFCRVPLANAQAILPEQQKMLTMPYGLAILCGTLLAAGWVFLWH
jgi:prepilin peptidase CpaA